MSFIDDVLQGRAAISDFDSYSEAWHNAEEDLGEFHDYMGLLWPEYALWATDHDRISGDDVLAYVVAARRQKAGFLDHLRSVRGQDVTAAEIYRLCGGWAREWEALSQRYGAD